uniref:Uncharacterized protein n=1 Tax=Arundo donax TaxID=35708 RepID=A0A0A8YQ67_ARUDO
METALALTTSMHKDHTNSNKTTHPQHRRWISTVFICRPSHPVSCPSCTSGSPSCQFSFPRMSVVVGCTG